MIRIEEVEHTADLRLRLCVDDESEIYKGVVEAIRFATEVEVAAEVESTAVLNLKGDIEDQIFDMANELIYHLSKGLFPVELSKEGELLKISLGRVVKDPHLEVKALTYHDLMLRKTDDGFCTYLVFDI
ncbi:MAG: Archease protein family [Thermotogota bacterium]|nr:Archease protein family [Thermotogota bacterium]MDK2865120.1 Archease protein family [Thermotogota bacterium]HCZ06773.1 hypothetical protein [Thermotogota bacterium]